VNLVIYGGLRQGELVALEWPDVDTNDGLIRVRQSGQYLSGQGVFTKDPKNDSSKRMISLPKTVISLLKQYKLWQNGQKSKLDDQLWIENNRLFTQWNGKPIFPDTPSKWFSKFIKNHNKKITNDKNIPKEEKEKYLLPEINFHGLRHTNATLLIGQGVDIKTVSSRLGHARTSTTADIYSHSLKKTDKEAADKLENLFNQKKSDSKKQA